jgi:TonB family protein
MSRESDLTEARNHILQTGDWVVPTLAGEPFMEKPPAFFVTAAAFASLFGGVLEVQVRQSSGSAALDRAASEGVRKWRFRPATVDGQPVAEWYRNWEWVFKLEG